ncbi:MAG: IclR family transcriptional regulator, partial [Gammaproteobacteria bacterium]|nr:IclR family transcriptional regulator [Gammaproteobacteria bacterium]
LPRYTSNTLTQITKLWSQIANVHKQGYALDNEEAEQGVSCIGVPVRDAHGVMLAGISISAPRERRQQSWIPLIKKAGTDLSTRLGYITRS